MNAFVHRNFERIKGDYQTIDKRCVYGFLEHFQPTGLCVDVCAPSGSGIVDTLLECGYRAEGEAYAFDNDIYAEWIITNPPYERPKMDQIIKRQIRRIVAGEVYGVAMLLRPYFSFAKSRNIMFDNCPFYSAEIKLQFRPWWSDDHSKQPIHYYVWQLWRAVAIKPPATLFASGEPPAQLPVSGDVDGNREIGCNG